MTAKFVAALTLAVIVGWSGPVLAAGSKEAGQTKSAVCMACHGMDGNSANPEWPSLAGQHTSYIVKQLKHFKAGDRQNPLMTPMAAMLSENGKVISAIRYLGYETFDTVPEGLFAPPPGVEIRNPDGK